MIAEQDRIVLTTDLPDDHLASGDVGTMIHVYAGGAAYAVEMIFVCPLSPFPFPPPTGARGVRKRG